MHCAREGRKSRHGTSEIRFQTQEEPNRGKWLYLLQIEAGYYCIRCEATPFSPKVLAGSSISNLYTGMLYKACFLQLTPAISALLGSACLAGLRLSLGCSEWLPPSPARTVLQSTATDVAYASTSEYRCVQAHCPSMSMALSVILKSQHYLKNPSAGADLLPFAIPFQVSYRIICAAGFSSSGWTPTC